MIAQTIVNILRITFALLCVAFSAGKIVDDFAVAAYLPEWRYGGANFNEICKTVTHLIFFSLEPTPTGSITGLDRFPGPDVLADARNKGCQLIICFGGNGRSGAYRYTYKSEHCVITLSFIAAGFSSMTRNDQARVRFVKNVRKLVLKNDLDGVDYNW